MPSPSDAFPAPPPVSDPVARRAARGPHVAVIGAGAFGGWSALMLLRAGARVTLVDAWGAGNSRSSSGDETRIIRMMYNGDATYTDMATRAFALWREEERRWGRPVYRRTGALWMFEGDDSFARASLPVLRERGVAVEALDADQCARRFPQMSFDGVRVAYYEPEGGYLLARESCELVRQSLVAEGGEWRQARVEAGAVAAGRMAALRLDDGSTLDADAFVFACGAWMGSVFPDAVGRGIIATRQEVLYVGTPAGDTRHDESRLPVWLNVGERRMYGIPGNERRGFKIGDDTTGEEVEPTSMDRLVSPATVELARATLARRFPALAQAPILETRVCQYEYSPDSDYLLDRHPACDNAWLLGGGSGHGFKMGPALGELVAGLVLDGTATAPQFSYAHFDERRAILREPAVRRQHR